MDDDSISIIMRARIMPIVDVDRPNEPLLDPWRWMDFYFPHYFSLFHFSNSILTFDKTILARYAPFSIFVNCSLKTQK